MQSSPLNLQGQQAQILNKALQACPKFNGDILMIVEKHIENFPMTCMMFINIIDPNVAIKLFVHSSTNNVVALLYTLSNASITNWDELMLQLKTKYSSKKTLVTLTRELSNMQKGTRETTTNYVDRFEKILK